ncbi:uncharacterized protein LOC143078608 [Mytilus galloprovincialis]|uniref:uncharacterized protein LOC143078608 n=1 Tax=Mytilus galloprovincialis TaxID=29158 RepID=UPI003F7C9F10
MVFQCNFDEISNYVYDVYWYINAHYLTEHNNILYSNRRQTDLRPDDWVGKHHMNMIVRCSVRLRNEAESFPGPYYESDWFKAGIYDIAFNSFQFCGITVPAVYKDSDPKIQFNVTGYIDGQYNKGIHRITRLRLKSLKSNVDLSGAWDNITIPDIKISVSDADEKMKNRLCKVYNDPHFVTADGKKYDYHGTGEYILYKNTKYPYQVNALFTECANGRATCNCGVAIQSGQSLFVVRTQKVISKISSRGLYTPIVDKRICDDKSMIIDEKTASNTFEVTLPIGTKISFKYTKDYITYIHVKPSVLDLECAEGLCGYISSQNGKKDDDFRKRNETVATTSISDFAESWELTNLQSYCTCASEAGTHGGIADKNYIHCNLSQPMEACYDVKTDLSLDSRCSNGNLQPKAVSDPLRRGIRSTDDTDDVIDFTPLIISDDVFDDSIYIGASGDISFMSTTLDTMLMTAKEELERNQTLKEEITDDGKTVLEKLTSLLCLNNCSSNGNCVNGECVCNTMFGGEDCSTSRTTPPTNISVPELGLCQSRKRSCKKTNIMGYFMPPDVWCNIQHFEILENNRSYLGPPTISKAVIKHSYMVSCEFANARRKRSTPNTTVFADGFEIRLSNDGSNYGEVVTLIVYDEECYTCTTVNFTCTAIETCPLTRAEDTETEKEQNEEKDENNIFLPFGIIAGLVVLGALIGLIVYKVKHKDIGHRQIDTSAKGNPADDIFAINFATQNIPPTMKVLDQRYTPRLKNEYSSASRFSLDFQDGDRRTPDHLFLVENKYN